MTNLTIKTTKAGKATRFELYDGDTLLGSRKTETMAYTACLSAICTGDNRSKTFQGTWKSVDPAEVGKRVVVSWHLTPEAARKAITGAGVVRDSLLYQDPLVTTV